jgi:membrane protein DedA with SNARE-associated domain
MIAPALLASTAIILLSFVSEDAATISSALSIFGGPITWPLGFLSCFLGIWAGDLGLYSVARYVGKPVLHSRWLARFTDAEAIERCQQTFAHNGTRTLFLSRFVPGTRLPTYVAAGLLAMPARRFALVTGIAALVWISGIFVLTKLLGSQALAWFTFVQSRIAVVIFTALCIAGIIALFRATRRMSAVAGGVDPGRNDPSSPTTSRGQRPRLQCWLAPAFVRRWAHWEFWPGWLFYTPVGAWYAWLAFRHHSFTLPTSANPGIPTGGFIGESKFEILKQLQDTQADLVAEAFLLEGGTTADRLLSLHRLCREHNIALPFILKPDVGQRGNGVRLVRSMREALDYLHQVDTPVILQRYAAGEKEAGVFYFRFPDEAHGQIFSITEKIFPFITGNGAQTIEELVRVDSRAALIAHTYLKRFADRKHEILAAGERLKLVESGNHAQGCIFRDGGHLWSEGLERKIDEVSRAFPGFYVGRFDIRYGSASDLRAGRNFQIVELNGASSEATSIYDSRTSLRSAYRVLFRQWELVFAIGAANRARGHYPSSLTTLWRDWRRYSAAALSYPVAS